MKFTIVLEEDLEDGGYIVHCPALKGCRSQGDTIEEALHNIKEAIAGYLKTLNERAMTESIQFWSYLCTERSLSRLDS
jgi:predicted RNase H-like HicB family nuclease